MKKRKKRNRPSKDCQGQESNPPSFEEPTARDKREPEKNSNPMTSSDGRHVDDDESTTEGYDTEVYGRLQSTAGNANDDDDDDDNDDELPTDCTPSERHESKTIKKQKEPKNKQKPKVAEQTKSRKRGRPPKVRISCEEKLDAGQREEAMMTSAGGPEVRSEGGSSEIPVSFTEWTIPRHQLPLEIDPRFQTKEFDSQQRLQGHKLSENFAPFQMKQISLVQSPTTGDKENNNNSHNNISNSNNNDDDISATMDDSVVGGGGGNVIEIVCGPNRGLMHLSRLSLATGERCKTKCIQFNERWWTPSEFQMTSGRGAAKDWKRTIRHGDKCLKALLESGTLKLNLCNRNACFCQTCHARSPSLNSQPVAGLAAFADQAMKVREIDQKEATFDPEKKMKKRNNKEAKEAKPAKQKRMKIDSELKNTGDQQRFLEGFRSKEFKNSSRGSTDPSTATTTTTTTDPFHHLLRNQVPPSVAELFLHQANLASESSTSSREGDSFQVFNGALYHHHHHHHHQQQQQQQQHHHQQQQQLLSADRPFLESNNKICADSSSSSRTFQDAQDIQEGILHPIRHRHVGSRADGNFSGHENFWKENMATDDSQKTMLRAVVEELKKKKKKSLSSSSSSYPGEASTSNPRLNFFDPSSGDAVVDLSKSTNETRFHRLHSKAVNSNNNNSNSSNNNSSSNNNNNNNNFDDLSPPSSSSPPIHPLSTHGHTYGLNSSLFHQTFQNPHFNLPLYSPYIFMGFPIHPIISQHARSATGAGGFQLPFPSTNLPFSYEFGKHLNGNPLLSRSEDLLSPNSMADACYQAARPQTQFQKFKVEEKPQKSKNKEQEEEKEEEENERDGEDEDGKGGICKVDETAVSRDPGDLKAMKLEDDSKQTATTAEGSLHCSSALDFSLKAWKNPSSILSSPTSGLEALDLSRRSLVGR